MQCRHPEACSVYGTYWCPGFRDVNRSCLSGGTKHLRSTLSNSTSPRLAQVNLYLGTVHAFRPCALLVHQHRQHEPALPPSSTTPASHRIIALIRSASQHRLANSRVFSSTSVKSHNSFHLVSQVRDRAFVFHRSNASHRISSSRDFPSIPSSIRLSRHQSISQEPFIPIASPRHLQNLHSRSRHSRACSIQSHLATCTFHNSQNAVLTEAQG